MPDPGNLDEAVGGVREPAHTPGPWMVAAGPSSVVGWPVVAQRGQSICNLSWLGKKPDHITDERFAAYRAEVYANGRLIAAAPDLADAARRVLATKKAWDDYAKIGMPARALLEPPDRQAGNKTFTDLARALAKTLGDAP